VVTNFTRRDGFGDDFANGVAIQADGKIVAVGRAGGGSGRFALARYLRYGRASPRMTCATAVE
jgi:hypothetical protein